MEQKVVMLSAPWITYYHEIDALFKKDPEVKTEYDDETCTIKIFVDNQEKAEALEKLLTPEVAFGGVTLKIVVVPSNAKVEDKEALFRKAFEGNPIVRDIVVVDDMYCFSAGYVVFSAAVVQFFNDELGDINGIKTMLYQDVAKDVFKKDNGMFFFCTEKL